MKKMREKTKQTWRTWKSGKQWITASSVLVVLIATGFVGAQATNAVSTTVDKNPVKIAGNSEKKTGTAGKKSEITKRTSTAKVRVDPKMDVVVHNFDELSKAIAKAGEDDVTDLNIQIDGTITGGRNITIGDVNIHLYGGELKQAADGSMATFTVTEASTLYLDGVKIDASVKPIMGIFSASGYTNDRLQSISLIDTEIKGTQGKKAEDSSCAINLSKFGDVNLSGNSSISNFNAGILELSDAATSIGSDITLEDTASLSSNGFGISLNCKDMRSSTNNLIKLNGSSSISNNTAGIYSVRSFRMRGEGETTSKISKNKIGVLLESSADTNATTMENITFDHNEGEAPIKAILNAKGSLNLTGCNFTANVGEKSGGIYFPNDGALNVKDSKFDSNVSNGNGGAIALQFNNNVTLENSKFFSNQAAKAGGAIGFYNGADPYPNDGERNANEYLGNITADKDTVFRSNHASALNYISVGDKVKHDAKIHSREFSALGNAYNNYDLQYYNKSDGMMKINFETNGASAPVASEAVKMGGLIAEPQTPTRKDYTFLGWYQDKTLMNKWDFAKDQVPSGLQDNTLTLYAKWEEGPAPVQVDTVKFESNGGSAVADETLKVGELVKNPTEPTREGYKFVGWYQDKALMKQWDFAKDQVPSDLQDNTLTLYAKWEKDPIPVEEATVKFDCNGGSAVADETLKVGELVKRPADPTCEGRKFAGWYQDKDFKTAWNFDKDKISDKLKDSTLTLYAKWISNKVETKVVYRLYNVHTGEHFYTTSKFERNQDILHGWKDEGILGNAPVNGKPVYRLYNPNVPGGDHYYTLSKFEANKLVENGWKWDNNGKPVFYSGGDKAVYVAYNPHAISGSHNYTTSVFEQKSLLSQGWKFGSVAWYTVD